MITYLNMILRHNFITENQFLTSILGIKFIFFEHLLIKIEIQNI
jgi:hypothetical protein